MEIGYPEQEEHDLVIKVRLHVSLHLLAVRTDDLTIALSLLDPLQSAQNVAEILAKQVDCQIKCLVVGTRTHIERQNPCLLPLLLDDG